jgi:hypothetical protein
LRFDRPGLGLRFRRWYLATAWYWSDDFGVSFRIMFLRFISSPDFGGREI